MGHWTDQFPKGDLYHPLNFPSEKEMKRWFGDDEGNSGVFAVLPTKKPTDSDRPVSV
jgi:hypothetical protein